MKRDDERKRVSRSVSHHQREWSKSCRLAGANLSNTHKETSCFHTGLCADNPPNRPPPLGVLWPFVNEGASVERPDETLDWGDVLALFTADRFACSIARELIAPRALMAVEDGVREWELRVVATPRASFSCSWIGSRETNSFCSNWATIYGRAWRLRQRSPRAWISLTCNWPRETLLEPWVEEDGEGTTEGGAGGLSWLWLTTRVGVVCVCDAVGVS